MLKKKRFNKPHHWNSYGYYTVPYNDVLYSKNFTDAFVATCKRLGDSHVIATMKMHLFLQGFFSEYNLFGKTTKSW